MARALSRQEVRDLQAAGALIVEVLPADEYYWKHIAGAISLPLRELGEETASRLDRRRPVVAYCNDFQ